MTSEIQNPRKASLLLELEAILDIRYAVLKKLYPDFADDILQNKEYRLRRSDEMHLVDSRVDQSEYAFEYAKKDITNLAMAKVSLIKAYINQLIGKIEVMLTNGNPILVDVNVVVNHYPFVLDEHEAALFAAGITAAIGLAEPVKMVYLKPQELTLEFFEKNGVFTYLVYDFYTWSTSALPDKEVEGCKTLDEAGLKRAENLTVIAPKLATSHKESLELEKLCNEIGASGMIDDLIALPFNLLFELELLPVVIFTQYDEQIAERLMSVIGKSNSPLDVEIAVVAEYYEIVASGDEDAVVLERLNTRMVEISTELLSLLNILRNGGEFDEKKYRKLLVEQRFVVDSIASIVPCNPAEDFERYIDSKMSTFDINHDNSVISETHWNNKGVKCNRFVRRIPSIDKEAFILYAHADCADNDGVIYKKNDLLKSVFSFDPIFEDLSKDELARFIGEVRGVL